MGYWNPGWPGFSTRNDKGVEMDWTCFKQISTRVESLARRVGELEGQPGAFLEPWVSHLETRINDYSKRIQSLEELHYKNQPYPKEHKYPEPTHSKPKPHTCGECQHPFYRSDFGLCRSHPVVRKGCQPIAIWREHEACDNFKGES